MIIALLLLQLTDLTACWCLIVENYHNIRPQYSLDINAALTCDVY